MKCESNSVLGRLAVIHEHSLTWSDSLRAESSSSSMQVSTTKRKIGGMGGILVMVYSRVENWGISSAG